ncbi:MAG: hypothetical protein IKQ68_07015 [Prevotella sp.]|nr:hypothetical protein [Prevotella sp.]
MLRIGYRNIRKSLLQLRSRDVLVFFFFLVVSAVFWLLSTLNETYEMEVRVPLNLDGVPAKVIVTDDLPDTIRVSIRDKGFNLLRYTLLGSPQPLSVSFQRYATKSGKGVVTPSDVQKLMKQQLSESTVITNVKAEHWDFFYTYGEKHRLPFILNAKLKAAADYYVLRTTLTPDSVDVYASHEAFDTISAIYTEPVEMEELVSSVSRNVQPQHVYGTKVVLPRPARLTAIVDRLTEVTVSVPVKTVNVPENVLLKTFPARMDVRVSVGVSNVKVVRPDLFVVVADYNDMPVNSHDRFPLKLMSHPKGIVRAYLKSSEVDYIIEHLAQ